jgi:hypothetical protein
MKTAMYNDKKISLSSLFFHSLMFWKKIIIEMGVNEDSDVYQVIARVKAINHYRGAVTSYGILQGAGEIITGSSYEILQKQIVGKLLLPGSCTFKKLLNEKLSICGDVIGHIDISDGSLRMNAAKLKP